MLCSRIRKLRVSRGMTQVETAERLGVSQAAYSRLEKGDVEISVGKLMDLCSIYGVMPEKLLEGL